MSLAVFGLNYKTAPLTLREQFAYSCEQQMAFTLTEVCRQGFAREAMILSTCNRTEWYVWDSTHNLSDWWLSQRQLPITEVKDHLYHYQDAHAVHHAMRVACGLDSMVVGEPQILGQIKSALQAACQVGTAGPSLTQLFNHVFAATKQVRHLTEINTHAISVVHVAMGLIPQVFADSSSLTLLLLGAGETVQSVANYVRQMKVKRCVIANRALEKAQLVAEKLHAEVITLEQSLQFLAHADVVISATASPVPILGKGAVERAIKMRKHRVQLMLDLAVPRDIEPEVAQLEDVFLYNMDDLQRMTQQNLEQRLQAASLAEDLIAEQVEAFIKQQRLTQASSIIRDYRTYLHKLRQTEVDYAKDLIKRGYAVEEVIERLAHRLTQKLAHTPTCKLRALAQTRHTEALQWARDLLMTNDEEL